MKWTVIAAAGAFVLSLAGSTAFIVLRTPVPAQKTPATAKVPAKGDAESAAPAPAAPLRAAPAADSAAKAPVNAAVVASSSPAMAPVVTPVMPAPSAAAAAPAARVPAAPPQPAARAAAPETPADYAQVAKMLTSMKPAGATEIMSRLNDDQVEGILRALGVRQASTLFALLPAERAAALSKRLMQRPAAAAR